MTQAEVEEFYRSMADPADPEPVSYGLNSKLVKDEDGTIRERVWKVGGMYSPAIEKIVYWLEKAQGVAQEPQKATIAASSTITKPATCTISTVITSCGCGIPYPTSIS